MAGLGDAQAGGVAGEEQGTESEVAHCSEELLELVGGPDVRQNLREPGPGDAGHKLRTAEAGFEEGAESGEGALAGTGREHLVIEEEEQVVADVVRREQR